jgi:ABC-type lipoprotein release transport system permease subunit
MRAVRWIGGTLVRGRAMFGTAVRGVIVNRMRAFLSSLGIAIGVATLIAIVSLVQGLSKSFGEQIAALGANTIYRYSPNGTSPWTPNSSGVNTGAVFATLGGASDIQFVLIPEPASAALTLLGAAALVGVRKSRRHV